MRLLIALAIVAASVSDVAAQPAQMVSPAPASTLTASAVTFQWTSGSGVSLYALYVGTTPGASDLYLQGLNALSAPVSGLPTDGRVIYVRLWSLLNGAWQSNDYSYKAGAAPAAKAQLTAPTPGSTLTTSMQAFGWTAGSGASLYALYIGTTLGGSELYSQGTNDLVALVANLPMDGRTLYVRLWSLINGAWQFNDYTYKAGAVAGAKAQMTSPAPGSTLVLSTVTFEWTTGSGVALYALYVGKTPGAADLYLKGLNEQTATVTGLPTDGRTIYVRLWSLIDGAWQLNDYTYKAGFLTPSIARMTSPEPGGVLTGSTVRFQWAYGNGVPLYALYVGTTAGGSDLYSQGITDLNATVSGLPTDGRTIYVRLWSLLHDAWQSRDYTYIAGNAPHAPAQMSYPAPGSTLTGSSVSFIWTGGTAVRRYAIYVGSTAGEKDLGFNDTTLLGTTFTNLPTDGRTLYVRLWSLMDDNWYARDYTYTAVTVREIAPMECTLDGRIRSVQALEPVPIRFVNNSAEERRVFWLNYEFARVFFRALQPDESVDLNTYMSHPWLVTNALNQCQAIYLPIRIGGIVTLQ